MITLIKKIALIALLCYCMVLLTSCNTIHGMGKDFEVLGSKMQKKSSDKK
jgi:predicted small secreted protein